MTQGLPMQPGDRLAPLWRAGRRAAIAVFVVMLAFVPLTSAGRMRERFTCEWSSPLEMWWAGAANFRHGVAYAVACLAATIWFKSHRLGKAIAVTFVASAMVELQQAIFIEGHCRVRDLLPNSLAVCLAAGVWITVSLVHEHWQGVSKP